MKALSRRLGGLIAVGGSILCGAPSAEALTINHVALGQLTVTAAPGEANNLTVTHPANTYVITDTDPSVTTLSTTGVCTVLDPLPAPVSVSCSDLGLNAANGVTLNLGDMNDTSTAVGLNTDPFTHNGGDGADTIRSSDYDGLVDDVVNGDNGADVLTGGNGEETLNGGAGDAATDRMDGGVGADAFDGGPGIDRVLYDTRTVAVTVTIDGTANDGQTALDNAIGSGPAGDNVGTTVESVTGGSGGDSLTGNCTGANTFAGLNGGDTLQDPNTVACSSTDFYGGGGGNDIINGRDGTDTVTYSTNAAGQPISVSLDGVLNDSDGVGGTDNLATNLEIVYGGAGDDIIDASAAAQGVSLFGRAGADSLFGSASNDMIRGETGVDTLDCNGGLGDMWSESGEDTQTECETPF